MISDKPRIDCNEWIDAEMRERDLVRVRGSRNAIFREALALCRSDGRTRITERDVRNAADAVEYAVVATGSV